MAGTTAADETLTSDARHPALSRPVERSRDEAVRRVGAVGAAIWLVLPLVPLVLWAAASRWPFPNVLPTDWGLSGWTEAWRQGAAGAAARSATLGFVVALIATPLGAMAGRSLAQGRVPFRALITALLILPIAVPPFAVVLGLSTAALRWRVPDALALTLVLVVAAIPYTTLVMRAAYASYDTGVEDEARTLGAGSWDVLVRVRLPLVAPALFVAAYLAFLVGWSDYVMTLFIGGGRLLTLPQLLASDASGDGNQATVAALAVTSIVVPLALLAATVWLSRRRRP